MKRVLFLLSFFCLLSVNDIYAQETGLAMQIDEAIHPDELRIMTWNIQMLPRFILRTHRGPLKRARRIPEQIFKENVDIVVFQEAFDVRARRLIKRRMKKMYPYEIGPANESFPFIVTNSGVQIYSKIPIKKLEAIRYKECSGYDCMARKGALLVEGEWKGQKFQVMGTHMQAGGTQELKKTQYQQVGELLEKYKQENVPQFLCGDFNTRNIDTILYPALCDAMKCEPHHPIYGEQQYTSDGMVNTMTNGGANNRKLIDFIFYKSNGLVPYSINRTIRRYTNQWSAQYNDLSDHLPVLARIIFKKPADIDTTGQK